MPDENYTRPQKKRAKTMNFPHPLGLNQGAACPKYGRKLHAIVHFLPRGVFARGVSKKELSDRATVERM